ncbi:MAG: sodium-dependent transporter [Clostridia bacterium]|nr:sodium-dependent transporter [Clostridia bacterium]
MSRERLGSRLGFIFLSAGCAIGCGNVWKFPWMTGQYGGGGFVLLYLICLVILGLPCLTMEFSIGRASQASPVKMYQKLEKPGQKWHFHGYMAFFANFCLMAFYTVVTGWMFYYFCKFVIGQNAGLSFGAMITNWKVCLIFMLITVVLGYGILCLKMQNGLERITKIMMALLFALLLILSVNSMTLSKAAEGLKFYLVPDFSKMIHSEHGVLGVIVAAMNQAFFTLSLGIGSMAIFGSYIGKEHALMGESVRIIALDTLVAVAAGLIIFPACFTYNNGNVNAGPGLLFETMATVFNHMKGGRLWGSLFFLFMSFAAFSTVLSVFENILACIREIISDICVKKGTLQEGELISRPLGCLISSVIVATLSVTTALSFSLWSGFVPFAEGTGWLDFWDFLVSTNSLPLGALVICLFCCFQFGWGWDNFVQEANAGKGMKVRNWMKPIFCYIVPAIVIFLYIYGLITFPWK